MKYGKILLFIGVAIFTSFIFIGETEAATTLPAAVDGKITLTENVNLDTTFQVNSTENITLDLNGFTITGPTNGYTIENNRGDLVIVDTGAVKGKIVCPAKTSSCVRLLGKLTFDGINKIDGVTIESEYVGIKVEGATPAELTNNDVTAWIPVQTAGPTTIANCHLKSVTTSYSTSFVALYAVTSGNISRADVQLNNSTLEGKGAFQYEKLAGAKQDDSAITVNGGTLNVKTLKIESTKNPSEGVTAINGNVTAPISALKYAKPGSVITLTEEPTESFEIPEGVTVKVSGDKEIVKNEDGTYSVVDKKQNEQTNGSNDADLDDVPKTGNTFPILLFILIMLSIASGAYTLSLVKNRK